MPRQEPRQGQYTSKMTYPVVRQTRPIVSAFCRCLRIGPTMAKVTHGFPSVLCFLVITEQLSGGSVVVVHEEPHPQMTGTLSYKPEETGGKTAGEIARHTTQATGRPILRFTMARRLHGGGLFAVRFVPLTPAHRRRHSLWCREHRNWRDNEWGRVLFTDESSFSLSSDSHRILIWRERRNRNHPSNIIERNRGAMGLQFLFMDDNASCHRTVAAEQLLESGNIERMDWPAGSPNLNPIEHVWNVLGRRLAARTFSPVTIRELRLALQDEWAAMPQQLIDTLILSMGRRCETCLAVRGDHIPY
ncbi:transposable element Tc3 transposase [Trichonephila clavipes]|nr:transposable element Tc3 transposase [Trichonephila clavipes]